MPVPDDVQEQFYASSRSDELRFVVNDSVRVTAGPHAGRTGCVISIVSVKPETTFLVEPGESPWGDLQISQSKLELID